MKSEVYSILEQLNDSKQINETTLYQQNKNICMKVQRGLEKAINSYLPKVSGTTYAFMTKNYYHLNLEVSYRYSLRDLSWEEYQGTFYLMAVPCINFVDYFSFLGSDHQGDLHYILKEHIEQDLSTAAEECLNSDIKCDIKQLRKDIAKGKSSDFDDILYPKVKKAVDTLMNSKYSYEIHSKLHPEVRNRTKIPLVIFNPETCIFDFVGHYNRGGGVNPSKDREVVPTELFLDYLSTYTKTIVDKLPISRWVNFTISKSNILLYDITI